MTPRMSWVNSGSASRLRNIPVAASSSPINFPLGYPTPGLVPAGRSKWARSSGVSGIE